MYLHTDEAPCHQHGCTAGLSRINSTSFNVMIQNVKTKLNILQRSNSTSNMRKHGTARTARTARRENGTDTPVCAQSEAQSVFTQP